MENARIYNLQGQLVGTGAEALKSLHRGIYVMNGKKIRSSLTKASDLGLFVRGEMSSKRTHVVVK